MGALVAAAAALLLVLARYRALRRAVDDVAGTDGGRLGRADAVARSVRDLRRRAEDAEAEAERYRTAVEETTLGIIIADRNGGIVFANRAGREALEGRLGDSGSLNRLRGFIERVTETGEAEELEFDMYTPERRVMRFRAVPLPDHSGWENAAAIYIRDLSGQRRVEAMRRDFVTNAGHELKTPLGALAVLAETIGDAEDAATRHRLGERLRSEANRMAQVVDDILTLADIESLETPFERIDLGSAVREAVGRVSVAARDRGVTVATSGLESGLVVDGNQAQVVSALANLLDNAVKYSPSDGEAVVGVSVTSDADQVSVEVSDCGPGIPAEHLDRIFERFYRAQSGRGRLSGGTGLGLSIVRNVAETHGGSVSVRSTLAEGSTFAFRLPRVKE